MKSTTQWLLGFRRGHLAIIVDAKRDVALVSQVELLDVLQSREL